MSDKLSFLENSRNQIESALKDQGKAIEDLKSITINFGDVRPSFGVGVTTITEVTINTYKDKPDDKIVTQEIVIKNLPELRQKLERLQEVIDELTLFEVGITVK